ncbi:MAG TPA: VWA domain-containing protein [Vicinamibacteria bacterium]
MDPRPAPRTVLLALVAAQTLRTAAGQAQTPAFPAQTERVIVDVVVTDAQGRPLPGLTRDDFVVKEDGAPQAIMEFEAVDATAPPAAAGEAPAPGPIATNEAPATPSRAFLVMVDDLNLSPAGAERVGRALRSFVSANARETDCLTLAFTAGGAWWTGCGSGEREDVVAALGAIHGRRAPDLSRERMSDYEAMRIEEDNDPDAARHVALRYAALGLSQGTANAGPEVSADALGAAEGAYSLVRMIASQVYARARERNEATLRALERAMLSLGGGRGRRVVVLASEGFVQDQRLKGYERVREAARRSNAALYFLDARGSEIATAGQAEMASMPDPDNRFSYMTLAREYASQVGAGAEGLAADTGGFTIRGSSLEDGLRRLGAESRVFYLLGYSPAAAGGGERRFRKIDVEVRRPGAKVRARRGYYPGPLPEEAAKDAAKADDAPLPVRQALDAVEEARTIPLRLMPYVLGNAEGGRVAVVLSAEADPAALAVTEKDGRVTGALLSFSTVAARDTGELGRKELRHDLALPAAAFSRMAATWMPVAHNYELPPGRYQARLVVLDSTSGRLGSVRQTFDVPAPQRLRLATPVLTDMLAPPAAPGEGGRPVPVARRSFGVGSRLLCAVEVWGVSAADPGAVEIVYELRRGDGSVITRTPPRPVPADGRGVRGDVFKLTLNRPGSYELRLQAREPASSEEVLAVERFEVRQ